MCIRILKYLKRIAVFAAFLASANTIAQSTEEKISFSQESQDSSDYNYRRKYQYLDINMKEENSMFSVAVAPYTVFSGSYGNLNQKNFSLGLVSKFDKKLTPAYSLYSEIVGMYSKNNNNSYYLFSKSFRTALNFGLRYYYKQNKNIQMKMSASNFSGPYLDLKLNSIISIMTYSLDSLLFYTPAFENLQIHLPQSQKGTEFESSFLSSYTFSWGYQQKISNHLSMDGSVFLTMNFRSDTKWHFDNNLNTNYLPYVFGFSIKFGLGWGWK